MSIVREGVQRAIARPREMGCERVGGMAVGTRGNISHYLTAVMESFFLIQNGPHSIDAVLNRLILAPSTLPCAPDCT